VDHRTRAPLASRFPVHVTVRIKRCMPSLRGRREQRVLVAAFRRAGARSGFRIVHYSVQSNHVHFLIEAHNQDALARGMCGLATRMAAQNARDSPRPIAARAAKVQHAIKRVTSHSTKIATFSSVSARPLKMTTWEGIFRTMALIQIPAMTMQAAVPKTLYPIRAARALPSSSASGRAKA